MNENVLYQWTEEIETHLPSLNSWQVANVAQMSYGVIKSKSSQQQRVGRQMRGREQVASAMRRIRRFMANEQLNLACFFREWVDWLIEALGQPTQIDLVVDETKIHDRLGVMMVGVAWQAQCIPLIWRCYTANEARAYPAEGQVALIENLLAQVKAALPASCQVCVLSDRGIGCSPDLCRAVERLGWFYLFRVTSQTKVVTPDGDFAIAAQVQPGELWTVAGLVFKKRGLLPGRALAAWALGAKEPWALVTNHPDLSASHYANRMWVEHTFRDLKSGGWHWDESLIRKPDHLARWLVVLAVSYVWVLALGSRAVHDGLAHPLVSRKAAPLARFFSLFREGLDFFVECLEDFSRFFSLSFFPDFRFT